MNCKEIRKSNYKHNGSILHVDDEVIPDLRHDIAQSLRKNDIHHGLNMRHANGFGSFRLSRINRNNASSHRFRHIGTRVDGNNYNGCHPHRAEFHRIVCKIGQTIIKENRLKHHRRSAKHFNVYPDYNADQCEEEALYGIVVFTVRNCVEHPADKPDQASDHGSHQCQNQCVFNSAEIGTSVFRP